MAKDTEKLIRQLSLISYLMAERRPVTAQEIRRDVEGYSAMNEDAFARRFYADRSELEALRIYLSIEKPVDGLVEQETYSLAPENFHLPPIEFTDQELAALHTALQLLDGEFAYAEPLRLALQQISWGRPSPLSSPEQHTVALGITGSAGGHELSQRLAKIETAIFRRKTIVFDYYTMERGELGTRRVDAYQLLFQGGQFYLVGYSHERRAIRVFRLSRIRGKVGYATKAEHDFQRPADFDPRAYAGRIDWQFGDPVGTAEVWIGRRIAWQIERHFGRYGEMRAGGEDDGDRVFVTPYANARQLIAWVLGLGEHARIVGPPELADEMRERVELLARRHTGEPQIAAVTGAERAGADGAGPAAEGNGHHPDGAIRPERFARLVTLASILIDAGRAGRRIDARELRHSLKVSEQELREDISVLNLVNFGAGTYVLYAELGDDGMIEVEPEPYGDSFARPARLLPVEAKALVAAIDLIGEHIPEGSLTSVREKVVAALGEDPVHEGLQIAAPGGDDAEIAAVVSSAIAQRHMLSFEYYKENEDEFSTRTVEPYALINGREGWYVATFDPSRGDVRHFRLDRFKSAAVTAESFEPRPDVDPAADVDGWPRTGEVPASRRARVWISPERARWAREERTVTEELADGAVVVERGFASLRYLVRDVLKEAGDAVVLEPDDARAAVREAAEAIRTDIAPVTAA
ncbi:MAG: WYL domain-containing protein [Solirubrobacterales bacterium]|nr:WYL domain-containing protein [Solirubrobacterales bacterium]MBV9685113.1 WYL domain-containing protein [Solirubrobacterales bacterium]MBV9806772.1 WYL domain-containing protein [Solirubrobacterales bacterium]